MIKVIICIAITAFCTYGGIKISQRYKRKERLFFDFVNFCNGFKANLDFFKKNLDDYVSEFCQSASEDFIVLANAALQEKADFKDSIITDNQKEYTDAFFAILGKGDANSQKNQIISYQNYFERQLEQAKEQSIKKGSMYAKLGTLTGIFLSVLVI